MELTPGASLLASWSHGVPMEAISGNVVGVNLFPDDSFGLVSGDYRQLFVDSLTGDSTETPEPATLAFAGAALAGLLAARRRARRQSL